MNLEPVIQARDANRNSIPYKRGWGASRRVHGMLQHALITAGDKVAIVAGAREENRRSLPYRMRWTAARAVERLLTQALASVPPLRGAMVVNVQAMWDQENATGKLKKSGVTHVAFLLPVAPLDQTKARNAQVMREAIAWFKARGFKVGGFVVSHGLVIDEAKVSALLVGTYGLDFLIVDTERLKTDNFEPSLRADVWALQSLIYDELRLLLGPFFRLFNITFGIHQDKSVVDHSVFDRFDVDPVWEAYDGIGVTLGVDPTAAKAESEGHKPPVLCIGDKNVPQDAYALERRGLTSWWLWAPEQTPSLEPLYG